MTARLFCCAVLAIGGTTANAQTFTTDGSFVESSRPVDSAAVVASPLGGDWLYRFPQPAPDGRPRQRFTIGKVQRTEYSLFTAQEEAALWETREKLLHPAPAPSPKHAVRKAVAPSPAIDWPKVQVMGDVTCVPAAGYGQSADWQAHKVCWNKGTRHVE
jgi:hypothetical protein